MTRSFPLKPCRPASKAAGLGGIQAKIARGMIGRMVHLLVSAQSISHGVVTDVRTEAGMPKLVVGGIGYDLSRVLTVTPVVPN